VGSKKAVREQETNRECSFEIRNVLRKTVRCKLKWAGHIERMIYEKNWQREHKHLNCA